MAFVGDAMDRGCQNLFLVPGPEGRPDTGPPKSSTANSRLNLEERARRGGAGTGVGTTARGHKVPVTGTGSDGARGSQATKRTSLAY